MALHHRGLDVEDEAANKESSERENFALPFFLPIHNCLKVATSRGGLKWKEWFWSGAVKRLVGSHFLGQIKKRETEEAI